jgi:hypothetical protein
MRMVQLFSFSRYLCECVVLISKFELLNAAINIINIDETC